ncbi:hypothetical protein FRC08_011197 [Ceratobasidium sp. 394]|nr:hypothetical protein FRC08_011197 [Ceratobasidium sp. 394]
MTRFLASPTIPSSPPSARSGTLQSPSAPSSPAQQGISFYGAGLDMNELDRYYQLASPASGGSMLSRSASFYTHFSSPSQDFQPSSPVSGSTITKLSSPMFPPPASPPSFATQLSSQAHTSAQDDCLTPLLPPPVSASSTYPQSPVVGPPPAPLPPSSPLPNTSSSPFEDDPFIETTRPPTRTGTLPILDNTCSLDYELPNVGTSSTAELPGPVKRRGRVYSTRARPSKTRAGPLGAGAGVTKAPRIKSKVPTRARKDKYNHPAAGREPGSSTHPGQDPVPTSASSSSMPYLSPAELLPTGLAPPPDVCATPVLTPLTPTGLGSGSSSQAISARFTLPTPAMTASFATPSTATSLATPTSTGLHCPPEVVNSYSTPASFATGLRDGAKRRRFTRHATPSPISVPEHLGMLDDQTVEVHAKAAGCASAGEEVQVPEKVEPDTEDYLTRGEGVTNVAPTNANDRPPGVLESVSHLKRSKRAREETDDDTYVAKRAKENIGVTRRNEKVKLEPVSHYLSFFVSLMHAWCCA